MNNDENLKILKSNNKGLLITLITLIIGIALIVWGTSFENKEDDLVAKSYSELISSKKDEPKEYVNITIAYLPYLFAEETDDYGGKKYYIVFDNNDYPYIVRLTDTTYNILKLRYDNKQDISYEISGYLFKQQKEMKDLAIEAHKEIFEDSMISEANYELYFGKCYLDETLSPSTGIEALSIGIGIGLLILSFFIFIFYIVFKIKHKRSLKKYSREELESELLKPNVEYFKKANICLTDKYIISTMTGLDVIKYEDILWIYYENRRYNFVSIGKYIVARLKNKKMVQLAYTYNNEELLIEIMKKIKAKNEEIMLGFTKENQERYKELTKKH